VKLKLILISLIMICIPHVILAEILNGNKYILDNITAPVGYFHGAVYFNGSFYAVRRGSSTLQPATLCKFNATNLSQYTCVDYHPITHGYKTFYAGRNLVVVNDKIYIPVQWDSTDYTGFILKINPNTLGMEAQIPQTYSEGFPFAGDGMVYCDGYLWFGASGSPKIGRINITDNNNTREYFTLGDFNNLHSLLCDENQKLIYGLSYSISSYGYIVKINTTNPLEYSYTLLPNFSISDDTTMVGDYIYTCVESSGEMVKINKLNYSYIYRVNDNLGGCYGVVNKSSSNELYWLKATTPMKIVVTDHDLNIKRIFVFSEDFSNANEGSFNGDIFLVTTWTEPAKVIAFNTTIWSPLYYPVDVGDLDKYIHPLLFLVIMSVIISIISFIKRWL
jgi:hypothetical protein